MTEMVLGDKKPSQLLREMRELAANDAKDDMLHTIWIQRLPADVQPMLAMSETMDLNSLAEMADRIMDSRSNQYVMATTTKIEPGIAAVTGELIRKMADMQTTLLKCLSEINELKQQRPSRARSEGPRREKTPTRQGICFYHRKFGDKATRCLTPCDFIKKQTGN